MDSYPSLAGSTFSVAGKGWHSLAIDVDDRLIFKFPAGEEAEAALRREAALLAVVRPAVDIPVPDMVIHDGPRPFSMHVKLRGGIMPAERYMMLGEAARQQLGEALGLFFAQMHAIDREMMRAAGALPVELSRTDDAALAFAWPQLPEHAVRLARLALADYRALPPDPLGEVYAFIDAHGWNMAYDEAADRLAGMSDFADSGFASPHREFVQTSLISPDLTLRAISAYESASRRLIDRRRVFLLTAAHRLSEFAGMIETNGDVDAWRGAVVDWFDQTERFGWQPKAGR